MIARLKQAADGTTIRWIAYCLIVAFIAMLWDRYHHFVLPFFDLLIPTPLGSALGREWEKRDLAELYFIRDSGYFAIVLIVAAALRVRLSEFSTKPLTWWQPVLGCALAVPASWIVSWLGALLHLHGSALHGYNTRMLHSNDEVTLLLSTVAIAVVSPLAQEIYFRGMLMRALAPFAPAFIGIFVSSAIFALWHLNGGLAQVFFAFVTGLMQAVLYRRTGNLIASLTMHMSINAYYMWTIVHDSRLG